MRQHRPLDDASAPSSLALPFNYQPTPSSPSSAVRLPRSSSCASPRRPASRPSTSPYATATNPTPKASSRPSSSARALDDERDILRRRLTDDETPLEAARAATSEDYARLNAALDALWTGAGPRPPRQTRKSSALVFAKPRTRWRSRTRRFVLARSCQRRSEIARDRAHRPNPFATPGSVRRPRTEPGVRQPSENALATARPPQVGRVVSLPLETTRRRGAPSGRSPTVVTSRDVGSATRRAGFDGASASASRLREAAEVVSAMDATLERARVMENGAAGGADGSRGGRATNRAGAVEVPAHGDGLDGAECARGPRGRVISG